MAVVDKAALLGVRDGSNATVTIEGFGDVVVRALTRKEALSVRGDEMDVEEMEVMLLSLAVVDPQLTEDEVRQWQAVSPAGELEPISEKILELSGMKAEASKEAIKRFRK
jgi:hypothetical protein